MGAAAAAQHAKKEDVEQGYRPGLPYFRAESVHSLNLRTTFSASVGGLVALILPLYYVFVRYSSGIEFEDQVERYYNFFIGVEIMVFIGFGCLMTFLRRYSYSAIAFNFFVSAFVIVWAILGIGLFQQIVWGSTEQHQGDNKIRVDMPLIIDATFCAASAMIVFGAFIGKATPTQVLWLMVMFVPIYAMNQQLVFTAFKGLDIGGSITIHAFGAYFGLAASYFISRKQEFYTSINTKNAGSYYTDVFSMIGTLALWIFWPSFNSALASFSPDTALEINPLLRSQQFYVIINTVTSLLGSCLSTFAVSALISNKFNMMHIQNASLAGGVAMGAASNLYLTIGGALTVGLGAGAISTLGFAFLTPFLERTIGLGDTCGVHNLHGMPGIIGGLVAAFASLGQAQAKLSYGHGEQFGYQIASIVCTVAIAILTGSIAGWIVSAVNPAGHRLSAAQLFDDGAYWQDVDMEPLPRGWDGGSVAGSVHRGGAATWRDGSLHGAWANNASYSKSHRGAKRGGSQSGTGSRGSHDRAADPDGSRRGLQRDSPSANPTSTLTLPHTALQRASLGIGATPAVTE